MLDRIWLENFKASRDVDVRLAPLTLLAGLNGSGKSTLLQALAAIRQSYLSDSISPGLNLAGDLVHLGHSDDVLSETADSDTLTITVEEEGKKFVWTCRCPPSSSLNQLDYLDQPDQPPKFAGTSNFQFLHADRIVPETLYPQAPRRAQESGFLGIRGEYTADFLSLNGEKINVSEPRRIDIRGTSIPSEIASKVASTPKLLDQVAGWMQHLSPGVRLAVKRIEKTDEVQLIFYYTGLKRESNSNEYRPTNVGFGLTYTLPIVTACLAAQPGALLLLENPEAHLHPQGQVALGELVARCAADGVQVIVESHSDHFLNGIRLAVKTSAGTLKGENVALHLFTRDESSGEVWVQTPTLLDNGRLSNWPDGFFNQWGKSIDALLE